MFELLSANAFSLDQSEILSFEEVVALFQAKSSFYNPERMTVFKKKK